MSNAGQQLEVLSVSFGSMRPAVTQQVCLCMTSTAARTLLLSKTLILLTWFAFLCVVICVMNSLLTRCDIGYYTRSSKVHFPPKLFPCQPDAINLTPRPTLFSKAAREQVAGPCHAPIKIRKELHPFPSAFTFSAIIYFLYYH